MISSISQYQRQPFPSPFPCVESSSTRRLGLPGVFRNSIANTQKMWDGIFVAPHKEACTCANESRGRSETQNWKSANVAFQFEPHPYEVDLWSCSPPHIVGRRVCWICHVLNQMINPFYWTNISSQLFINNSAQILRTNTFSQNVYLSWLENVLSRGEVFANKIQKVKKTGRSQDFFGV